MKEEEKEKIVQTSVRFPKTMLIEARKMALDNGISFAQMVIDGLRMKMESLKEKEK